MLNLIGWAIVAIGGAVWRNKPFIKKDTRTKATQRQLQISL